MMRFPLALAGLLLACLPSPVPAADDKGTFTFVFENDAFYDTDRHYTNGVRVIWVPGLEAPPPRRVVNAARRLPWFPQQGDVRHGYAAGHSMFTPADVKTPNPPLDDRPYAGWLYGTVGIGAESNGRLDQFGLTLGVVGPASLAEYSQEFMHAVLAVNQAQGWDTQLRNEPGVMVTWQRSWRGYSGSTLLGSRMDATPHVGAAVGNIFTYGSAGLTLRYGRELPRDYGPPRMQSGGPGFGEFSPVQQIRGYVFAGIEGRAVARNIFLDGNTFEDSRRVEREIFVADLQVGFVLDWEDVRFSYTHSRRTREFLTQHTNDDFGAFSVSVKY